MLLIQKNVFTQVVTKNISSLYSQSPVFNHCDSSKVVLAYSNVLKTAGLCVEKWSKVSRRGNKLHWFLTGTTKYNGVGCFPNEDVDMNLEQGVLAVCSRISIQ